MDKFESAIVNCQKTMTTRTKKYGERGDRLRCPFGTLELVDVVKTTLENVAENCWREEGVISKEEFIETWKLIHNTYDGKQKVWLHTFKFEERI